MPRQEGAVLETVNGVVHRGRGGERGEASSERALDWAAMEAEAAKLRTIRVERPPGERIGLRLLSYDGCNATGVLVVGVRPDSAGEAAGLRDGDIIVELANTSVIGLEHAMVLALLEEAGDAFDVIVSRG